MLRRCYIKEDIAYPRYGGRGIKMCDEWKNSFIAFYKWSCDNGYSDNLSIDRIDNNGNYCPENCRWADNYTQANNKRNNRVFEYKGKCLTLSEWCKILNIPYKRTYYRINSGWSFEDAIVNKKFVNDHNKEKTI